MDETSETAPLLQERTLGRVLFNAFLAVSRIRAIFCRARELRSRRGAQRRGKSRGAVEVLKKFNGRG